MDFIILALEPRCHNDSAFSFALRRTRASSCRNTIARYQVKLSRKRTFPFHIHVDWKWIYIFVSLSMYSVFCEDNPSELHVHVYIMYIIRRTCHKTTPISSTHHTGPLPTGRSPRPPLHLPEALAQLSAGGKVPWQSLRLLQPSLSEKVQDHRGDNGLWVTGDTPPSRGHTPSWNTSRDKKCTWCSSTLWLLSTQIWIEGSVVL